MRAKRLQHEQSAAVARALKFGLLGQRAREELRLAGRRVPLPLARRILQVEAARLAQALVVVFEARDDRGDAVADEIVVIREIASQSTLSEPTVAAAMPAMMPTSDAAASRPAD